MYKVYQITLLSHWVNPALNVESLTVGTALLSSRVSPIVSHCV